MTMRVFLKILSLVLFLISLYFLYILVLFFESGAYEATLEHWKSGAPDNLGMGIFLVTLFAGLGFLAASIFAYRKSRP